MKGLSADGRSAISQSEIERDVAKPLSQSLSEVDLNMLAAGMPALGVDATNCRSLEGDRWRA